VTSGFAAFLRVNQEGRCPEDVTLKTVG
jgi:hypothetical protein